MLTRLHDDWSATNAEIYQHAYPERPAPAVVTCPSRISIWRSATASGLLLARLIWQGLTVANDAAFHWWVACSPVMGCDPMADSHAALRANDDGWNDGLLYYDPSFTECGNQRIHLTKRFAVMGHFSRYVRPGARRHDVTGVPRGLRVAAFSQAASATRVAPGPLPPAVATPATASPALPPVQVPVQVRPTGAARSRDGVTTDSWTIILINTARSGAGTSTLRLQLPTTAGARFMPQVTALTSADAGLEPVAHPQIGSDGLMTVQVRAESVTTCLLQLEREHD